jgi:very-short-patch-repair endonuclease
MTPKAARRDGVDQMVRQLSGLATDRVVHLLGTDADLVTFAAAHGTAAVPAVVAYRAQATSSVADVVHAALDVLELMAVRLFPAWLPEAASIRAPGGAGLAAVRATALAKASRSAHFGPFLMDLAVLALSGVRPSNRRFPPEILAIGLARVIAESFDRDQVALLVRVPSALTAAEDHALAAGSEWLVDHGRLGVWLIGEPLAVVDRLTTSNLPSPPGLIADWTRLTAHADAVGNPHPRSAAETALEAALATQPWAAGRLWNQSYQVHVLRNPVRLDLVWPAERCVVEIDGPEHRELRQFEADRQRDVHLQLDGYAVLRFTNTRVHHDVGAVVHQIGALIQSRRRET